jgi:hypothetical protein
MLPRQGATSAPGIVGESDARVSFAVSVTPEFSQLPQVSLKSGPLLGTMNRWELNTSERGHEPILIL